MGRPQIDIQDVLLSVTNFCLGSCVYCELKSLRNFRNDHEIMVRDVRRLLEDPLLEDMENIHITGGEPVLSPKTYGIFKLLRELKPDIRCNMPVSGFFPEVTYRYCRKLLELMPQLRVDISLDGPMEIHERTRGQGSHKAVMRTIDLLRSIPDFKLQLQLTLMKTNYKWVGWVQNLAEELGLGFYVTFPHFGIRFGHQRDGLHTHSQRFIDKVDAQLSDGWCKKRPLNRMIWETQKAIWEGKKVYSDCYMGRRSIDVDPFGDVYPCMVYRGDQVLGNIRNLSLTEIFNQTRRVERIFNGIDSRMCQPCLMPCCPHKDNFEVDGEVVDWR